MVARVQGARNTSGALNEIHFIINSLSPNAEKAKREILTFFDRTPYSPEIKLSKYKGHAIALAQSSIFQGAKMVVACGGDGTVNEVAQGLVNTSIKMGILPIGSGNGLARHLGIPTKLSNALEIIRKGRHKNIDVGRANNRYFLCNISIAFSAEVIKWYEKLTLRGYWAYSHAFIKALKSFRYSSYKLEESDNEITSTPFLLLLSNTDQLGYNKTLTPDASLFDGKLDLVRIEKTNYLLLGTFVLFAFFKKFPGFTKIVRKKLDSFYLHSPNKELRIQLDGEAFDMAGKTLIVKVLPKALTVIC